MVVPAFSTGVTDTAAGSCTSPLTTYSRNSCMVKSSRGRGNGLIGLLDETGDGVAGFGALANPVLGAVEFQVEIITLLERLVSTDFLDKLAIAGAAAVGDNNTEHRGVLRA